MNAKLRSTAAPPVKPGEPTVAHVAVLASRDWTKIWEAELYATNGTDELGSKAKAAPVQPWS